MAQAALFISRMLQVYSFLIWIRILFSWISPYPQPGSISYYLASIVDPFLNMFRSSRMRVGMFDFSPLIAIGLLTVVQSVFNIYGLYGTMTLSLIVSLFIQAFWSYGVSIFFTIAIFMLIMITIASFMKGGQFKFAMSNIARSAFGGLSSRIQRTFFKTRIVRDSTMSIIMLVLFVGLYFASRYLFILLLQLAARIPF